MLTYGEAELKWRIILEKHLLRHHRHHQCSRCYRYQCCCCCYSFCITLTHTYPLCIQSTDMVTKSPFRFVALKNGTKKIVLGILVVLLDSFVRTFIPFYHLFTMTCKLMQTGTTTRKENLNIFIGFFFSFFFFLFFDQQLQQIMFESTYTVKM